MADAFYGTRKQKKCIYICATVPTYKDNQLEVYKENEVCNGPLFKYPILHLAPIKNYIFRNNCI